MCPLCQVKDEPNPAWSPLEESQDSAPESASIQTHSLRGHSERGQGQQELRTIPLNLQVILMERDRCPWPSINRLCSRGAGKEKPDSAQGS